MRTAIIDDERKSREVLALLLELFCPEIVLVAEAEGISDGLDLVDTHQPELVFLDISLQEGDSFMLLEQLKQIDFRCIFITAYDEHSVEALQLAGVPCLHKPVHPEELQEAIGQIGQMSVAESAGRAEQALIWLRGGFKQLPLRRPTGWIGLEISEIRYAAFDNGVKLYGDKGKLISGDTTVDSCRRMLLSAGFKPLAGSRYLYNPACLVQREKGSVRLDGGIVLME
jgi:two-component system, LytTR family, response regulator